MSRSDNNTYARLNTSSSRLAAIAGDKRLQSAAVAAENVRSNNALVINTQRVGTHRTHVVVR